MYGYKKLLIIFFVILLFIYIFVNLGKFLDITQKAVKSDVIVSLGGPSGIRLQKALVLYKEGYSRSNKIIYTGSDHINKAYSQSLSKYKYLLKNNIKKENIIHIDGSIISNTMEELFFIKKYLLKNNLKSVIFVSHPQHSRRIRILANIIASYKKDGILVTIVACKVTNWDKNKYYKKKNSLIAALSETLKLVYNLIKYSPLLFEFTELNRKMKYEWNSRLENFSNE